MYMYVYIGWEIDRQWEKEKDVLCPLNNIGIENCKVDIVLAAIYVYALHKMTMFFFFLNFKLTRMLSTSFLRINTCKTGLWDLSVCFCKASFGMTLLMVSLPSWYIVE